MRGVGVVRMGLRRCEWGGRGRKVGGGRNGGRGEAGSGQAREEGDSGGIPSIKLLFSGQDTSIRASMRNGLQCPASVDNTA